MKNEKMLITQYSFQDFMYVDGKLYIKSTEEDVEKKEEDWAAQEAENFWDKVLGMSEMDKFNHMLFVEWDELVGPIKIGQSDCEYHFSQEELIKIIKAFGVKEER